MLTLYYSPRTCSLAPYVALCDAGAEFKPYRVDFVAKEQNSEQYKKLNPKGRVPILLKDGQVLSECVAILSYVALAYPDKKLAPSDPFTNAQMVAFNAYLTATVHVAHAHKRRGYRWADDQATIDGMKVKVAQNMGDCFAIIENEFLKGPWVMGSQFTVADCYLFTFSGWLEGDGVDINKFPKVLDHYNRMKQRPAVIKALAEHEI